MENREIIIPYIAGWQVTTNENNVKMATIPLDKMHEVVSYLVNSKEQTKSLLKDIDGLKSENKRLSSIIENYMGFSDLVGDGWISVEDRPIPRDGKEYLTKNNLQGGVLNLISYDKINKCFKYKGNYIFEGNAGTHWKHV